MQRRASRCALRNKGGHEISYEEHLKILQWPTSEKRRDYLSLVECFKTIHGLNDLDTSMYFTFVRSNHRYKVKSVMAKLNSYKYSFFVRVIPIWNSLPEHVTEAESLMAFKGRLVIIPCSHINLNPRPNSNPNPNQRFICHVLTLMD